MCGATRRRYRGAPAPPVSHVYNMHAVKTCARRAALLRPLVVDSAANVFTRQEVGSTHDAVASLVHYNYAPSYFLEPSAAETHP
jgi:hypothetical protein